MLSRLFRPRAGLRFAPLFLVGLMLTACATIAPDATPAQRRVAEASNRFATTTAEGAVAGAVLGAGLGYLMGGGRGAAIGAGAGLATGAVAGYLVAQNNYKEEQTEGNLNEAIADANVAAADARSDAQASQQVAAEARTRAAALGENYRTGKITAAQYRTQLSSYRDSLKSLDDISKGLQDKATAIRWNANVAGVQGGALTASADDIDRSRSSIDASAAQMRQVLAATPSA